MTDDFPTKDGDFPVRKLFVGQGVDVFFLFAKMRCPFVSLCYTWLISWDIPKTHLGVVVKNLNSEAV